MAELQARLQDVDHILQSARESLRSVRKKFETEEQGEINVSDCRKALVAAEEGLHQQTEEMGNRLNSFVHTIPLLSPCICPMPVLVTPPLTTGPYKVLDSLSRISYKLRRPLHPGWRLHTGKNSGVTPGQQILKERALKNLFNPDNSLNRVVVREKFGIGLPEILESRPGGLLPVIRPMRGQTVGHLSMPPRANRVDPQLALPPVSKKDARRGIHSLIERCWIPRSARVTLKPSPVVKQRATLHPFDNKFTAKLKGIEEKQEEEEEKEEGRDRKSTTPDLRVPYTSPQPRYRLGYSVSGLSAFQRKRSKCRRATEHSDQWLCVGDYSGESQLSTHSLVEMPEPPKEPAEHKCRFSLEEGRLCETDPEFMAFKEHHLQDWSRIVPTLGELEKLLTKFAVPLCVVLGNTLADLAATCFDEYRQPNTTELLTAMENGEEVEAILSIPGRRFKGPDGKALAALKIQTTWRRHRDLSNYLYYKYLWVIVRLIEQFWGGIIKRRKIRQHIQERYAAQLERFRQRAKIFAESWKQIEKSKRVVIHIPSLGYCKSVRDKITYFGMRQNTQMTRLCEISDPNVDVIYVSPTPLTEETLQYYHRLLGLAGAVESGRTEDQSDVSHRYKVLVPEAVSFFSASCTRMCLASLLKYSPRTLKRISSLIRGRKAYVVPGVPHQDDVAVSDALDIPILGPEPELVARYSSKAGIRSIFRDAEVPMPPGVDGIYREEQLYECLTHLVLDNLDIHIWLFKLNDEFDGRGIGSCEVSTHLTCFHWLQREKERYGVNWKRQGWAQEPAFIRVLKEMPSLLKNHLVVPDEYKTWNLFLLKFLSQGGVVEALPPTRNMTTLTANFLLDPSGHTTMLAVADQIHAKSPLYCWGFSYPQCSIEPMKVNNICKAVGEVCQKLGLVGYIKIDLVTYINPHRLEIVVWAINLHFGYSDSLALSHLADYVTLGKFDCKDHTYGIAAAAAGQKEKPQERRSEGEPTEVSARFCVMSSRLVHSNLAILHYPVFFQLCRAHGIGFDIKEREGTLFTLIDNTHREHMGMITIGKSLQGTLATFTRQLVTIHEEVSTSNMQGISNFKEAIEDIENILATIQQNINYVKRIEEDKKRFSKVDASYDQLNRLA